jgi:arabinofuranosyltransferase
MNYPLIGIDDANIYFVYARNLANGSGFVYNIGGERVEGFTSLLWTLISMLAFRFTAYPELFLLVINITLVSLGIAYALDHLQQASSREGETWRPQLFWSALFLIIIFTSSRYVVWNTITLMENALWSTLLLVTSIFVVKDHESSKAIDYGFIPLSVLLLLTRPESILWVAVFVTVLFLRLAFAGNVTQALKALAPSLAGILICLTLLTWFRLQYFGYPLPNTYYAKVSPSLAYNLEQGTLYLIRYLISDPIAAISIISIFLACIYSVLRPFPEDGVFYLPVIAATGLLVPLLTGGDHFGSFRFYQNVYPILILSLIYFVRKILPELAGSLMYVNIPSRVRAIFIPGLALLLTYGFVMSQGKAWSRFPPEMEAEFNVAKYERRNGAFIQDLFSSLPSLPSIGVIASGGIKHSYGGEIVDLLGLNNTVMAHNHGDRIGYKGHAAFEIGTFFELQPEIVWPIHVNGEWQYNESELKARWENMLGFKGLFNDPRFLASYEYAKVYKVSQSEAEMALVAWFKKDFLESMMTNRDFFVERYEFTP